MNAQSFRFLRGGPTNWGYVLILIIFTILAAVGILGYSRYIFEEIASISQLPEIERLKKATVNEQKLAKDTVSGYVNAMMSRSRENVLPYLTGEVKEQVQKWPAFFGTSNPYLGSFEILSSIKLNATKFKFIVREYQEYTGEGIIGYNDETLIVTRVEDKYFISSIKTGGYVDIKETLK
ncbi:hypothetical protein KJA16_02070 [Patescibacteria group bacterium]|nr:hypothetical protein [Patescibacteria group bacterium]